MKSDRESSQNLKIEDEQNVNLYVKQHYEHTQQIFKKLKLLTNLASFSLLLFVVICGLNFYYDSQYKSLFFLVIVGLGLSGVGIFIWLNDEQKLNYIDSSQALRNLSLHNMLKAELNLLNAAYKTTAKSVQKEMYNFSKSSNANWLFSWIAIFVVAGVIHALFGRLMSSICIGSLIGLRYHVIGKKFQLEQRLSQQLHQTSIPEYDKFEAEWLFSYESFGEDSEVYFEFLEEYFKSSTPEDFSKSTKFNVSQEDFERAQQLYTEFHIRLSAYHRARTQMVENFESKDFRRLIEEELEQASKKAQNIIIDIKSKKLKAQQGLTTDFVYSNFTEYEERLLNFN